MVTPDCQLGYPRSQVIALVGDRLAEFDQWMNGQTIALCDGRAYNYDRREYEDTGCGPHGMIAYRWDMERFLRGGPILD